ncbi:MAG: arsenate reductase (glutaredoxin) [Thioalkalispiraceae bacterium]
MSVTIYHNPRCSKSRQTMEVLEEHGIKPDVIEYLKTPPDTKTLKKIIDLLGIEARQLLRTQEAELVQAGLTKEGVKRNEYSEEQLIEAMVKFPKLIERPIVVSNGKAVIGRPPSQVLDII